ncbi:ROK family protein [Clostridium sp. YIM B02515]|uniref:ROK family protein n=1 Tax=Clostridium rhizosphaerae TaxID=2803861 RepID=A0ABS1TA41_9CLOT|nr:ROK family protein [Clostridium rhizosphaerae]MBL4936210.1 ROK family protein [Clostridium rhizosphaerae]
MDVGGTKIKAAIISSAGDILDDIKVFDSKSKESKENIINNFKFIMNELVRKNNLNSIKLSGVGLAFPGPFDYESGVSYIKGLNKYEHIYGINLKEELKTAIEKDIELKKNFENDFKIAFSNDGDLFSLGEYLKGYAKDSIRTICICIGTGAGSSFLERGSLIKEAINVPKEGWIYHTAYREGIVDDYISARGILGISKNVESLKYIKEVSQLYDLAMSDNYEAKEVFKEFGKRLREVMISFFNEFKPDTFVIGGQISKSFIFFGDDISKECKARRINLYVSKDTSESTLKGVAMLFGGEVCK